MSAIRHGGWWAVDVAGYLLTTLEGLANPVQPKSIDTDAVVAWVRRAELSWAPGSADLIGDVPWSALQRCPGADALVEYVLGRATGELNAASASSTLDRTIALAAQRLLPRTTLAAYGYVRTTAPPTVELSDGHLHQGAALPFEATLHWIAGEIASILPIPRHDATSGASEAVRLTMHDTAGVAFHPLPLIFLLRGLTDIPDLKVEACAILAVRAAKGDVGAWVSLSESFGFDGRRDDGEPRLAWVEEVKRQAVYWSETRRVATLRVEAILHGAVTQRQPGLDVFVELYEQLATLRRGRLDKERYYELSVEQHATRAGGKMRALELRLGEPITGKRCSRAQLEREYLAALKGYFSYACRQNEPTRVTFPLGLVKSRPNSPAASDHWRYNARGIYDLVEILLEILTTHPALQPFVDGIDVCGWEEGEPNWLFAPAFERFSAATALATFPPACRFHAGESVWSPLHGLRRIAEFLRFDLSVRTPRRIGHGLALDSTDWSGLWLQPTDELVDDLVWAYSRLADAECTQSLRRAVARFILDLRPSAYEHKAARTASIEQLAEAYDCRFDTGTLSRLSFLERDGDRLTFPDAEVPVRSDPLDRIVIDQLRRRTRSVPAVANALRKGAVAGASLGELHSLLTDVYAILAPELIDDIRWSGAIVEACPTSNVLAGGVKGHLRHPMRSLVASGVLVTVNSDDPALFHSWLAEEFALAADAMAVPHGQVARARQLSLCTVAPELQHVEVSSALRKAIQSLENGGVSP